jgi:cell wall-associated NlpC family hydrolase
MAMGVPVSASDLQPGDLVFFYGGGHVGIYIGNNQFIHAPHTGTVVQVTSLSSYGLTAARRIG